MSIGIARVKEHPKVRAAAVQSLVSKESSSLPLASNTLEPKISGEVLEELMNADMSLFVLMDLIQGKCPMTIVSMSSLISVMVASSLSRAFFIWWCQANSKGVKAASKAWWFANSFAFLQTLFFTVLASSVTGMHYESQ